MEPDTPHIYLEKIETEKGYIVVWRAADHVVSPKEVKKKKELERQEILKMINSLGFVTPSLNYRDSGQPILNDYPGISVSISHSRGWFALYIARQPVGVDIEVERESIADGKDWFINSVEQPIHHSITALHLVWSAKEAYYKKCEGKINDLKMDVTVKEINASSLILEHEGSDTAIYHRQIDNVYLAWT